MSHLRLCPPRKFRRTSGGGTSIIRYFSVTKARRSHLCDHCLHWIEPGQGYTGTVMGIGRHIFSMKQHLVCPVDPEEEQRRMMDYLEQMEREEMTAEASMAEAA